MTLPVQDLHRFLSVMIFPTVSWGKGKFSLSYSTARGTHTPFWHAQSMTSHHLHLLPETAGTAACLRPYWLMCPLAVENTSELQGSQGNSWPHVFVTLAFTGFIKYVYGNAKDGSPAAPACPTADKVGTYFTGLPSRRYFGTPQRR